MSDCAPDKPGDDLIVRENILFVGMDDVGAGYPCMVRRTVAPEFQPQLQDNVHSDICPSPR